MASMNSQPSPFLVSSWLNLVLYGCEISLGIFYFLHARPGSVASRFRWILVVSLCLDSACSAIVCYNAYLYAVILDGAIPLRQFWPLPARIFLTYSSAAIEQTFYAHRYWIISRNKWITSFMLFLIFTHVVFAFYSAIYLILRPDNYIFGLLTTIIAAVTCASTDVFTAFMMVYKLRRLRTVHANARSLIRRISVNTLACGIITSTATSLMLILLFTSLDAFTVIFDMLGRLYTLTILLNLLVLKRYYDVCSSTAVTNVQTNTPPMTTSRISRPSYSPSTVSNPMAEIHTTFTIPFELDVTDTEASIQAENCLQTLSSSLSVPKPSESYHECSPEV